MKKLKDILLNENMPQAGFVQNQGMMDKVNPQQAGQQTFAKRNDVRADPKVSKAISDATTEVNNLIDILDEVRQNIQSPVPQNLQTAFQRLPLLQQMFANVTNNMSQIQSYMASSGGNPFPSAGQGQYSESVFHEHDYMMDPTSQSGQKERQIIQNLKAIQMYSNEVKAKIDASDYRGAFDLLSELVNKSKVAMMTLKQYLQEKG
jgi:hypothetical protein